MLPLRQLTTSAGDAGFTRGVAKPRQTNLDQRADRQRVQNRADANGPAQ